MLNITYETSLLIQEVCRFTFVYIIYSQHIIPDFRG
jgi:hypothetical protein